jgi:ribosome-binding protein aMBF1 (putative translation factor)
MLKALAEVVREAREAADLTQLDIATAAKVSHGTISRLERARSWPLDPDRIVSAYEQECRLTAGDLWRQAVAKL